MVCCYVTITKLSASLTGVTSNIMVIFVAWIAAATIYQKVDACKKSSIKSSTVILGEHIPCGYSLSTIWVFDGIKTNYDVYRGRNCMKRFWKSLEEQAIVIINSQRKKSGH